MIAINWSKQEALAADLKAKQQLNFTGNLERQEKIFFIVEEAK